MRVLCVKAGAKYGPEYVTRLQRACDRHLPAHEFVCLTDDPLPHVDCRPLKRDLPSWWSKLNLFEPGAFPGENLYFDLDVVVLDDLSVFRVADHRGKLWALDDFSYGYRRPRRSLDAPSLQLLGGDWTCNSSVLYWHGDAGLRAWCQLQPDVLKRLHGDQNYLTQTLWPDKLGLFPDGLACSYKYHVQHGEPFGRVCVFHGHPKPPQLPRTDRMRVLWDAA